MNFHLGDTDDWYILSAAEAKAQFGDSAGALIDASMVSVVPLVTVEGGVQETADRLIAYLFPAEDTDPGAGVTLEPRERLSGVPDYYMLHVTNEIATRPGVARGLALRLDSDNSPGKVGDYVQVGAKPALKLAEQGTLEAWIDPAGVGSGGGGTTNTSGGVVLSKQGEYEIFRRGDGRIMVGFASGTTMTVVDSGVNAAQGVWTHVAATFDRGAVRIYVNGDLVKSQAVAATTIGDAATAANDFRIGGRQLGNGGAQNFEGSIDEVRVWNVARTAQQIKDAYNRVLQGDETGLKGYWRFEEQVDGDLLKGGDQVVDMTVNQNHGTLSGGLDFSAFSVEQRAATDALITLYGPGLYRIKFQGTLGDTLHVPASEAGQAFSSVDLSGQPVVIPLGDINGDGFQDAIVSIRDSVFNKADPANPKTFARIAFGSASGLDPTLVQPALTLQLPARLLAGDAQLGSTIRQLGDIDGDGFDDIGIVYNKAGDTDQGVYVLFGRPTEQWSSNTLEASDQGLVGEYFVLPAGVNSTDLDFIPWDSLAPTHSRTDSQIAFPNSLDGFGGYGELDDRFAVQWTGQIRIDAPGTYTFSLKSDDGSRLEIDGNTVVDNDGLHAELELSNTIELSAGFHDVRVRFFENFGAAGVTLYWTPPGSVTKQIVPSEVLFRDARGVINVLTDADLFIPVADGPVSVAGADVTGLQGQGLLAEFWNYLDTTSLTSMPSFVDGMLLRNAAAGGVANATTLTLADLPEHTSLDLEFVLAIIDAWQGTADDDRFVVEVDGVTVFNESFANVPGFDQSYAGAAPKLIGDEDRGFGAAQDSLYDLTGSGALRDIAHSSATATIRFYATGSGYRSGTTAESWGIDNLRVLARNGEEAATPVFGTDFNAGIPPALTGGGTAVAAGLFGPQVRRNDSYVFTGEDETGTLTGLPGFIDRYAARWSGQFFYDAPGTDTSGTVRFAFNSDDGVRMYLDGNLVVDGNHLAPDTDEDGLGEVFLTDGVPVELTEGYHDIRIEYFEDTGNGLVILAWDPTGGTDYEFVPAEDLLRGDGSTGGVARNDLVITSSTDTRVFGGRARDLWYVDGVAGAKYDGAATFTLAAPGAVAPLGDVNGDDHDDFGVMQGTTLRIYTGDTGPGGPVLAATVNGLTGGLEVSAAGDVDGDGTLDLLVGNATTSYVLFGGAASRGSLDLATLLASDAAIALQDGVFRAIGDFDGDGAADLGTARLRDSGSLDERGVLEHQVTGIYLGAQASADGSVRETRAAMKARWANAIDIVIEPARASYSAIGSTDPQPLYFGPLGTFTAAGHTYTRLGISGPAGEALHVYSGDRLGPVQPSAIAATPALLDVDRYRFDLATPTLAGVGPRVVPGIDVATDANPALRDAFALRGESENEQLSQAVKLADFNGDRESDLLVSGLDASYVLFGPVRLDDVTDVREEADIIVSADVGVAAVRSGDVSGDGKTDLVFLRRDGVNGKDLVLTVIMGGDAGGLELPRFIDRAQVNTIAAAPDQNRIRQLTLTDYGNFIGSNFETSVLNWDDDGTADILVALQAPSSVVQGFILSGAQVWGGEDTAGNKTLDPNTDIRAFIGIDIADRQTVAQKYVGAAIAADAVAAANVKATVAGDVNGDGLDDVLFVDSGFISFAGSAAIPAGTALPEIGRAYLVTGRTGAGQARISLGTDPLTFFGFNEVSTAVIEDFSIGGNVASLGDLNGDGYDDFAVSRTQEGRNTGSNDPTREGGLLIYYGQRDYGATAPVLGSADAAITIRRQAAADIPDAFAFSGLLNVTAGDFNADGKADIVVTEPTRALLPTGSSDELLPDERGTAYVLFSITDRGSDVLLTDANAVLRGESEFDRFGTLPSAQAIDLNGDNLDDLLIGAPGANRSTTSLTPGAGKLFVIYGASTPPNLPPGDQIVDLTNLTITGSGDYLVDRGTGRAEIFRNDFDGDGVIDTTDFTMSAGASERWYRFVTLGDGQPGSFIRVTPGDRESFVAPTGTTATEVSVSTAQAIGDDLIAADDTDAGIGGLFVGREFTDAGRITKWSIYGGDFADERSVTPVLFKLDSDGRYRISGIGTTRTIVSGESQSFDFGLTSGSDAVDAGTFLGWKDGSTTADNAGAIGFLNGGDSVRWLGARQGQAGNVLTGVALSAVRTDFKSYSINAEVVSGTVLEFDLGRYLDYVGNPDAIDQATLLLDIPGAAAALPAPTSVSEVVSSGGKTYFVGEVEGKGRELWVSDGTSIGTRLVKDILIGNGSSDPYQLTDVGGTLYFIANAGVSKAELWKSDGTESGTVKVQDIDGYGYNVSNLTASLGTARIDAPNPIETSVDYDARPTGRGVHVPDQRCHGRRRRAQDRRAAQSRTAARQHDAHRASRRHQFRAPRSTREGRARKRRDRCIAGGQSTGIHQWRPGHRPVARGRRGRHRRRVEADFGCHGRSHCREAGPGKRSDRGGPVVHARARGDRR